MRLNAYDYSRNGAYFVTICTHKRAELFGGVVGDGVLDVPSVRLSAYGVVVREQIEEMKRIYPYLSVPKYVVMPNHIHLIIEVDKDYGTSRTPSPTNAVVPQFVSTLKRYTNKKAGDALWQRSFHDHVIRNEKEYQEIWQYIDTNPLQWELDCYYEP